MDGQSDCIEMNEVINNNTGNALEGSNVWEAPCLHIQRSPRRLTRQGCDVWHCQPPRCSICVPEQLDRKRMQRFHSPAACTTQTCTQDDTNSVCPSDRTGRPVRTTLLVYQDVSPAYHDDSTASGETSSQGPLGVVVPICDTSMNGSGQCIQGQPNLAPPSLPFGMGVHIRLSHQTKPLLASHLLKWCLTGTSRAKWGGNAAA
jgi:hypothetical protein